MDGHDFLFFGSRRLASDDRARGVKTEAKNRAFVTYLWICVLASLVIGEAHIREFVDPLSAAAADDEIPAAAA